MVSVERERKKAEKQAKFDQKKAKAATAAPTTSKTKEKKANASKKADEGILPPYVEDTPFGEKKIIKSFDDPQYKAYNPTAVESAWYSWWEKEGFFKPEFPFPSFIYAIRLDFALPRLRNWLRILPPIFTSTSLSCSVLARNLFPMVVLYR